MKERQTHGGKGDLARSVNKAKFDENFDRIFGKKELKEKPKGSPEVQGL